MTLIRESRTVVVKRELVAGAPITIDVADNTIALSVNLSDFLKAVVAEVGNPALIVTQAQLLAKLTAASEAVRLDVQQASSAVM